MMESIELTVLLVGITHALPDLSEASAEYVNALINRRNIRTAHARRARFDAVSSLAVGITENSAASP